MPDRHPIVRAYIASRAAYLAKLREWRKSPHSERPGDEPYPYLSADDGGLLALADLLDDADELTEVRAALDDAGAPSRDGDLSLTLAGRVAALEALNDLRSDEMLAASQLTEDVCQLREQQARILAHYRGRLADADQRWRVETGLLRKKIARYEPIVDRYITMLLHAGKEGGPRAEETQAGASRQATGEGQTDASA